ncbi:MAG TPA: hypothetical protein VGM26_03890 [Rhizomicrobium sp.]|jgi:hypothetical protein
MPQDLDSAYAQLKLLEAGGHIQIPEVVETLPIGTIDPAAGTFTFSVPKIAQTFTTMNNRVGTPTHVTTTDVAVIWTTAATLRLRFKVIPQQREATARGGDVAIDGTWNGGVTIDGYPTVSSTAREIVVDVGHECSAILSDDKHMDPPISRFQVQINFPDRPTIWVCFFALRPPVLGIGAFTLPALPVTIVYAPPQNAMKQNTVTYTSSQTLTRKITTSLSTTTNTRTVEAYSPMDLIEKASVAIAGVAAVVGSGGTAAAAPSVAGAIEEFVSAIGGSAPSENGKIKDVVSGTKDALTAVGNILQGFAPSISSSGDSTVATGDDHSVTVSFSTVSEIGTKAGLGPGIGDRIVFLRNVRVLWMAIKGEVNLAILGYESVTAAAVEDLQQSLQAIAGGGSSPLGLDAETIRYLLALDPLIASTRALNANTVSLHGPVIKPPRFVPASPPGWSGSGGPSSGDGIQINHTTTTDDIHSTTSTRTTVTDLKPGWIKVLCMIAENEETTTTVTMTTTQTTETSLENALSTTLRLYSAGNADVYDVKFFEDLLLKTYVILDADSPLLHGVVGNSTGGGAAGPGLS